METIRVGGRKYSDPDVLSLIKATGSLVDPRSSVLTQARMRLQTLDKFLDVPKDPIERLTILASICGIGEVVPMNLDQRRGEKRDAVLITTWPVDERSSTTHLPLGQGWHFPSPMRFRTPFFRTVLRVRGFAISVRTNRKKRTSWSVSAI